MLQRAIVASLVAFIIFFLPTSGSFASSLDETERTHGRLFPKLGQIWDDFVGWSSALVGLEEVSEARRKAGIHGEPNGQALESESRDDPSDGQTPPLEPES